MELVTLGARVLVGLVFLAAAAGKIRDVRGFGESVRGLPGVPQWSGQLLGPGVIGAEALVAGLLAVPGTAAWGFGLALVLDVAFLVVIGAVLRSGRAAACRCFGSTPREFGIRHVVRDALLGAVALAGLAGAVGGGDRFGVAGPAWVVCGVLGAVGALALVLFDEITDLYLG